jgi:hypothetical protein
MGYPGECVVCFFGCVAFPACGENSLHRGRLPLPAHYSGRKRRTAACWGRGLPADKHIKAATPTTQQAHTNTHTLAMQMPPMARYSARYCSRRPAVRSMTHSTPSGACCWHAHVAVRGKICSLSPPQLIYTLLLFLPSHPSSQSHTHDTHSPR